MKNKNAYFPLVAKIIKIIPQTPDTKTFVLRLEKKDKSFLKYKPGQFLMLSLAGYGEAPFTFASLPGLKDTFEISVRRVGSLTAAVHNLKAGDFVGVRGPYGNTFPLEKIKAKELLFVAGGCGIAPLRGLIQYVFKKRKVFGKVEVIYGCRTPRDLVFKNELASWEAYAKVKLTVDTPDESWGGACGVVCGLFDKIELNPKKAMVFLCGPAVMIKAAIRDLLKLGFKRENIYACLERYMKCGIGKCGHCYVGGKYLCLDGPNFSYAQMQKLGIEA